MRRTLLLTAAIVLTAGFGIAEGVWSGRWAPSHELDAAAARVADLPRAVGEWEGTDHEIDAREIAVGRLRGYAMRTYTHRPTGEAVTVMLLCGKAGPISAHTPDICFQGQGSVMSAPPARRAGPADVLPGPPEFWSARFERPTAAGPQASTALWAWSADGRWEAADTPRVRYARAAFLYKLYVIRPLPHSAPRGADDPVLDQFLRAFLPAAQTTLFPAAAEAH